MENAVNSLKEFEGKGFLPSVSGSFIILYHNGEFQVFTGTFEEAIKHVNENKRYKNYGHNGATIVAYRKMYTITEKTVEKTFV